MQVNLLFVFLTSFVYPFDPFSNDSCMDNNKIFLDESNKIFSPIMLRINVSFALVTRILFSNKLRDENCTKYARKDRLELITRQIIRTEIKRKIVVRL